MRHKRHFRREAVLGTGVLAAGLLGMVTPVGSALASPAAGSGTTYDLETGASVKALGYTWNLSIGAMNNGISAVLDTDNNGVTETHGWDSTQSFVPTAAKDLTVTSTDHATFDTGRTLSPVLAVSLAFTPVKASKDACASGSSTTYAGYVTGTATLDTGLRGVKINVTFGKTSMAVLHVGHSCVLPTVPKPPCAGGLWSVGATSPAEGAIGAEVPGSRQSWGAALIGQPVTTASTYLERSDQVLTASGQPAPSLNAATHTVAVTASGPITGSAVIKYATKAAPPAATCYLGGKAYTETGVGYAGSASTLTPFKANTILTGTLSVTPGSVGTYTSVTLKAK